MVQSSIRMVQSTIRMVQSSTSISDNLQQCRHQLHKFYSRSHSWKNKILTPKIILKIHHIACFVNVSPQFLTVYKSTLWMGMTGDNFNF
jgi:hypothetical protein